MNSWESFEETEIPLKEDFYSSLNMEDITNIDYRHAKRVFREFKMNNLGDYHDLYVQSDTLMLAVRPLQICASRRISLTLYIFYHYQDLDGKLA